MANCLIFRNLCTMTRALHQLRAEGVQIDPEAVAAFSPYIRPHISRVRPIDVTRMPPPVDYELPILSAVTANDRHTPAVAADD